MTDQSSTDQAAATAITDHAYTACDHEGPTNHTRPYCHFVRMPSGRICAGDPEEHVERRFGDVPDHEFVPCPQRGNEQFPSGCTREMAREINPSHCHHYPQGGEPCNLPRGAHPIKIPVAETEQGAVVLTQEHVESLTDAWNARQAERSEQLAQGLLAIMATKRADLQQAPLCPEVAVVGCAEPEGHDTDHRFEDRFVEANIMDEATTLARASRAVEDAQHRTEEARHLAVRLEQELALATATIAQRDAQAATFREQLSSANRATTEAQRHVTDEYRRRCEEGRRADLAEKARAACEERAKGLHARIEHLETELSEANDRAEVRGMDVEREKGHCKGLSVDLARLDAELVRLRLENDALRRRVNHWGERVEAHGETIKGELAKTQEELRLTREGASRSNAALRFGITRMEDVARELQGGGILQQRQAGSLLDGIRAVRMLAGMDAQALDMQPGMPEPAPIPGSVEVPDWKQPLRELHERFRKEDGQVAYSFDDFGRLVLASISAASNLHALHATRDAIPADRTWNLAVLRGTCYLLSVCLGQDEDEQVRGWLAEQTDGMNEVCSDGFGG